MFRLIQGISHAAYLLPLVTLSMIYQSFGVNTDFTENTSRALLAKEALNDFQQRQRDDEMNRKFNKISKFDAYDPVTETWSAIEDFKTVTIIDPISQKFENKCIYHDFWAYDTLKKQWHKVDINAYGYRLYRQNDQRRKEKKYSLRKCLRNLAINFNTGVGTTFHKVSIANFNLIRQGEKFYMQAIEETADVYEPHWFSKANSRIIGFITQREDCIKKGEAIPSFKNVSLSVPITPSLHYTLFKKVRIGGGVNFEINFLQKLQPTSHKGALGDFKTSSNQYYSVKYFGLVGYNIIQRPNYAFVFDSQIGEFCNLGEDVSAFFKEHTYLQKSLFFNIGIGYERNITEYSRFLTRLTYEAKSLKDKFNAHPSGYVKMRQPAIYLQVGIGFNVASCMDLPTCKGA